MRPFRRLVVVAAAAAVALAGCTDPASVAEEPTSDGEERTVHLYGTDGTMQNSFAAEFADQTLLRGMKGTAPLNQMPTEFTNRLREVDPDLTDFLFAGETYDAVVISALAAELAGTPDPEVVRGYITTVTTGGEPCDAVADCLELAADGTDLAYQGVSLRRAGLTDLGQPATASYATLHFGADGLLDDAKTEFVGSGDPSEATTAEPPDPGPRPTGPRFQIEPLKFGGLLPETGDLSLAYPPMIAGARLAVAEINDAGGVFGVDVEWVDGDTETSPKVAGQVLASHVEDGVHVIIGPAASGEAEVIMPDAVAAKRIMFSPSNTEASLSNADHDGYYFRTAPSDELQGAALADIMLRDGVARITIVARDDAYGRGLQANARESLLGFGVPTADIQLLTYGVPEEEGAPVPGLAGLVDQIIAGQPDGVLVIGFGEAAQVIQLMADQGLRPTP